MGLQALADERLGIVELLQMAECPGHAPHGARRSLIPRQCQQRLPLGNGLGPVLLGHGLFGSLPNAARFAGFHNGFRRPSLLKIGLGRFRSQALDGRNEAASHSLHVFVDCVGLGHQFSFAGINSSKRRGRRLIR